MVDQMVDCEMVELMMVDCVRWLMVEEMVDQMVDCEMVELMMVDFEMVDGRRDG